MAGLTERRGSEADSFWTWREAMYRFVERLSPDDLEAIAPSPTWKCSRRASPGWPSSTNLHHQPDGRPYDNAAEMSERVVAASRCGGHRSHAPAGALSPKRFPRQTANAGPASVRVRSRPLCAADGDPGTRRQYRIAPHSLRRRHVGRSAVGFPHLARPAGAHPRRRTDARGRGLPGRSWQAADRSAARHDYGRDRRGRRRPLVSRPRHPRRRRELARIAKANAVVGLCPITEANLGDGVFDASAFLAHDGQFGIGSDSLIRISAADELRTLGIRPAADAPAAQRAGRGDALDRPAVVRGGVDRRRPGDGSDDDGRHQPRQAGGLRGAGPAPSRARCRARRQPARCLAVPRPTTRQSRRSIAGACRWCRTAAMLPARSSASAIAML